MSGIGQARSLLFVPGDRPDRFEKAMATGADVIVIDLEDAVPPAQKASARENARSWLASGRTAVVRVNAASTPWHVEDVRALHGLAECVMLPKSEHAREVALTSSRLDGAEVIALVETARGVRDIESIAEAGGLARLALGNADLAAQLGVSPASQLALAMARAKLVLASAAASLPSPIDGVTLTFDDPAALTADLAYAVELGFTGKLCIHPTQVGPTNSAFLPSAEHVAWARNVIAAASSTPGVIAVDGAMIDAPVLERARQILAIAARQA